MFGAVSGGAILWNLGMDDLNNCSLCDLLIA